VTTTPSAGASAPAADRKEWWEHQQARRQQRAAAQAGRAAQFRAATSWLALLCAAVLYLTDSNSRAAIRAYLGVLVVLLLWLAAARARTVSWRFVTATFCGAACWAVVIAAASPVLSPRMTEVPLLVTPLALVLIAIPGRVRRFAVTDWLLLGTATGLGYQAVATGAWALAGAWPGGPPAVALDTDHQYLVVALIGVCTGLGIAAARHGAARRGYAGLAARIAGPLLPLLAFAVLIGAMLPAQTELGLGGRVLRALGSSGGLLLALVIVLGVAGLMIDTRRIRMSDEPGTDRLPYPFAPADAADRWTLAVTGPGNPGPPSPLFYALTSAVWAACCSITYPLRDLLVVLGAHLRQRAEPLEQARERGRATAVLTRVLRAQAFGPLDDAGRGRQVMQAAGGVVLVVTLGVGALLATLGTQAPGSWLGGARAAVQHVASADSVAAWTGLPLLGALLLLTAGAPGLALGDGGIRRLLLDHGRGAVTFTRPGSWAQRLTTSTVLELVVDALTTVLTLIPAAVLSSVTGSATSGPARAVAGEFSADPARLIARRRRQLSAAPDDTGAMLAVRTGTWDAASRRRWVDSRVGSRVYRITSADGRTSIPSDGLSLTPDGVAMVEAIHVHPAGAPLLYEGQLPPPLAERLLAPFDDEMRRYATVIRDPHNPVSRLRLVVASQAAGDLLGGRAREILGHDLDLFIVVDALGG
jgi:hypothetical protein